MAKALRVQLAVRDELVSHPGAGDRRIASRLERRGVVVSDSTVRRWRTRWGYVGAVKRVGDARRRARREDATQSVA